MGQVVQGFVVIGVLIGIGYLVARGGILSGGNEVILSRLTYNVFGPCLLVTVLKDADLSRLFSGVLGVSIVAAVVVFSLYLLLARTVLRTGPVESVLVALSSGYSNAGTLGIPVAIYFLGSAAFTAPIILFQALLLTPVTLAVLDVLTSSGQGSIGRRVLRIAANPLILATGVGVILAATRIDLPDLVLDVLTVLGQAAVPLVLIALGATLAGSRMLATGDALRQVAVAGTLKLVVMPSLAWVLGEFVFDLSAGELSAVVLLSALPSAQNVFTIAQQYGRGQVVARDIGLVTTVLSLPVLLVISVLFTL